MRVVTYFIAITSFLAASLVGSIAYANPAGSEPTDAQLARIQTSCDQVKRQLDGVHSSDALLRVNRGQLYEHMGLRLMTPFNTRVAASRLDGSNLLAVTNRYSNNLDKFRSSYKTYEQKLTDTLRIDCKKRPADFYNSLNEARQLRGVVAEATQLLRLDVGDYSDQLDKFSKSQVGN